MNIDNIPAFLLRPEDPAPDSGRERTALRHRNTGPPPFRGPYATTDGVVTLVEVVDTTRPVGRIRGSARLPDYLDDIDVGTVLIHQPVDPDVPPLERPWQAGRVQLDGVHWEEKTWPPGDRDTFVDHVARLHETTVPGDGRPASAQIVRRK